MLYGYTMLRATETLHPIFKIVEQCEKTKLKCFYSMLCQMAF